MLLLSPLPPFRINMQQSLRYCVMPSTQLHSRSMKHRLATLLLTAALSFSGIVNHSRAQTPDPSKEAANTTVLLWPSGAPEARGEGPTHQPTLDVYCPEKASGAAIVICPGGGYGGLAMDHEGKQVAQYYTSIGVTSFVLTYRHGGNGYHHPIPLNDAKRAIRWVRDHAEEYGIDPNRIGIAGFSAGGHLASSVATLFDKGNPDAQDKIDRASSRPDFLVLGYPVITLNDAFSHRGSRNNLLGPDKKDDDALADQLSSHKNVTTETPPTFIFQTDEDTAVPAENAVSFYLALRKNKVPAEMHIYQSGPHGVGLMHGDPILSTWSKLLTLWLRNQRILQPGPQAEVSGSINVNGEPVSWGSVTFEPENPQMPIISARVRNGQFKTSQGRGVPVGKHKLKIVFSAADVPLDTKQAPTGVIETTSPSPNSDQVIHFEVKEGQPNKLSLDLNWPTP